MTNFHHLLKANVSYQDVRATIAKHAVGARRRDVSRCARLLMWEIQDYMMPKSLGVRSGRLSIEWEVQPIDTDNRAT